MKYFSDSKDTFCDILPIMHVYRPESAAGHLQRKLEKSFSMGEAVVSRHLNAMIEAALFAKDCLFFVPTAFCIGIVGAAVFLSAKSITAHDQAKDARFFSDPGFQAAQQQQDAPALPGVQTTVLRRSKEQRMDECHSGSCLYGLQLASPGRPAQAHLVLPQP